MSEERATKQMADVSHDETEGHEAEGTSNTEKKERDLLTNPVEDIPTAGIDLAEKLVKRVDEFTEEIDELTTKGIDQAQNGYISQGTFVVRAKVVINSLQHDAYRATINSASSLESATFHEETAEEVKSALKNGDMKPLQKVIATVEGYIEVGMKQINDFDVVCDKTEIFCIKLEQICANEVSKIRNQKSESGISTLTTTQFVIVVALVVGTAAIILGWIQSSQVSSVVEISIAVIAAAGLLIFAIAKILATRRTAHVYDDTITSLERTKEAILSLRSIVNEFKRTQRVMISNADDALRQIQQFKTSEEQTDSPFMEDFVSVLQDKCQQLHRSAEDYKNDIAPVIKQLDNLDMNFN